MQVTLIAYINILLVFLLGAAYSFVELLNFFNTARSFFKSWWGTIYVFLNGIFGVLALILTFRIEINEHFLGIKILVAGTSALALLRVIIVPIKHASTGNNIMPMIDIILNHVKIAYDRERSKFDLTDIKTIMEGVDYKKAAESLPVLCSNLLRTISEEEGKKMNEEIQKLLTLEEGSKEIKAINLGVIIAKYIGIELLRSTVNGTREFISIPKGQEAMKSAETGDNDDLDILIEKFS